MPFNDLTAEWQFSNGEETHCSLFVPSRHHFAAVINAGGKWNFKKTTLKSANNALCYTAGTSQDHAFQQLVHFLPQYGGFSLDFRFVGQESIANVQALAHQLNG